MIEYNYKNNDTLKFQKAFAYSYLYSTSKGFCCIILYHLENFGVKISTYERIPYISILKFNLLWDILY